MPRGKPTRGEAAVARVVTALTAADEAGGSGAAVAEEYLRITLVNEAVPTAAERAARALLIHALFGAGGKEEVDEAMRSAYQNAADAIAKLRAALTLPPMSMGYGAPAHAVMDDALAILHRADHIHGVGLSAIEQYLRRRAATQKAMGEMQPSWRTRFAMVAQAYDDAAAVIFHEWTTAAAEPVLHNGKRFGVQTARADWEVEVEGDQLVLYRSLTPGGAVRRAARGRWDGERIVLGETERWLKPWPAKELPLVEEACRMEFAP